MIAKVSLIKHHPAHIFTITRFLGIVLCALLIQGAQQGAMVSRVTGVQTTDHGDSVTVRFTAADTIRGYQRPEIARRGLIVRLTDATNEAAITMPEGMSCRADVIRTFAVYRLGMPWAIADATIRRDGPNTLILSIRKQRPAAPTSDDPTVVTDAPVGDVPAQRKQWDLDVIVIDPGHGGVDGGAEGVNGALEKNIVLSIGRKLRELIRNGLPGTTVVMTRDDDRFIELYRRGQIANEAGGKLFISIHCNSMPTKPHPARGAETYILRPGRNADAARVAARENASVKFERSQDRYRGLDNDQLIVATMAQRSFVRLSELFAEAMQTEVAKATPLADRGVSQAGFFVLVGASMPNILFETAFLSNPDDAAYISSEAGQLAVARGMLQAIKRYARTYRSLLQK
jgi:N-acetylmuramoyl-L-alanine amidase